MQPHDLPRRRRPGRCRPPSASCSGWHAAVDRQQTSILWASGILLGAAVLALSALFEKRRNDVFRVLDELKHRA
jgi:hypothetical protein